MLHTLKAVSGRGVGYCIPAGATEGQVIRVEVDYIDRVPARMSEPFGVLLRLRLSARGGPVDSRARTKIKNPAPRAQV